MKEFEKIIRALQQNEVEFVVIGGFAAAVHGVTFLTQDIDLCLPFTEVNMKRIISALGKFHPLYRQNKKEISTSFKELAAFKNLYLLTDVGSVDLLESVAGLGSYNDLLKCSLDIELFDGICRVLEIEALIRSKEEMKRPKDRETIIQLNAIKERMSGLK